MRTFTLLSCCVVLVTVAAAAEPRPLPGHPQSRLDHLNAAAEHLKAAGLNEEAARILAQAENLRKETTQVLARKRQQAEALQAEIRALEQSIGDAKTIQLTVTCLELDRDFVSELRLPASKTGGPSPFVFLNRERRAEVDAVLDRLEKDSKVKILAETALVTQNGRPATMLAGGEFPVLSPRGDGSATVEYRAYGTRLETLPSMIDGNRLKLDLAYEQSARDNASRVVVGDQVIPGLTVRRVNSQVEMNFDDTALCAVYLNETPTGTPLEQVVQQAKDATIQFVSGEKVLLEKEPRLKACILMVSPKKVSPTANGSK
jgi:hypothetical protein